MVYPRRCPLCRSDYRVSISGPGGVSVPSDVRHATVSVGPGGTPSPWLPTLPGRLLTLRCAACRGEYAWDYFAGRREPGAAPVTDSPQRAARPGRRSVALPGTRWRIY